MESIVSIVPCLWDCSGKHARYIRHFEDNLKALTNEMAKLDSSLKDVNHIVEVDEGRGMRRTNQVSSWIQRVGAMKGEVDKILEKGNREIQRKCLGNCSLRYKLGKKVLTKLDQVRQLANERGEIHDVTIKLPVDKMCLEEIDGFDSKHAYQIHNLKNNLDALSAAVRELSGLCRDLKRRIGDDEKKNMKQTEQVRGWLQNEEVVSSEVNRILQRGNEEVQTNTSGSHCLKNRCLSYELGEEAMRKLNDVRGLIERGGFEVVAYELTPTYKVDKMCLEETVGLDAKFEEVWRWIGDKTVGIVGLYGIGGVGKTSILKKINNHFLDVKHEFDVVIWVTVSRPLNLGKIQDQVRKKLGVTNEEWNQKSEEYERAGLIFELLEKKKLLLLLDDLWDNLEFSKIGVPNPRKNRNTCKVVLTSRLEQVCRGMHADKLTKVDGLPEELALSLFISKVGEETLISHSDIPRLAKCVAEECHGIPLALITTGRAMAGVDNPREWEFAINQLRAYPAEFPGIENEVFYKLKFSYDRLPNETLRKCFLYCAIFPEDHNISNSHLIHLWFGEGFLDIRNGVDRAFNQGECLIGTLKRACLLEQGRDRTRVKMHDLIRDMALWLAGEQGAKKDNILVQIGDKWADEARGIAKWREAERISLWSYGGRDLANKVHDCPNLITLLVQGTQLKVLPNKLFESTKALKVLDVSRNEELEKLPASVGSLSNLQYLNMSETVAELPAEIEHMKNLAYLMVNRRGVSKQVISSLSALQVFRMDTESDLKARSEAEESELLEGLACLQSLEYVDLSICHGSSATFLMHSLKLVSCIRSLTLKWCEDMSSLSISRRMVGLDTLEILSCSELKEMKIEVTKEERIKLLCSTSCCYDSFHRLHHVLIGDCNGILNLTCLAYAPNLATLEIRSCSSIEEIIGASYRVDEDISTELGAQSTNCIGVFSSLTSLKLANLPKLRTIFPHALTFPSLEKILVIKCPSLKKLPFDFNTAEMSPLEEIRGSKTWFDGLYWENEETKRICASNFKLMDLPPRRGQIKARIFAGIVNSIARLPSSS